MACHPGAPTRLAENIIRDWVQLHQVQGRAGLIPALRGDKGKARVVVTRERDAGTDLSMDRRTPLAARVTRIAQSLVARDGTSIRETLRVCSDTRVSNIQSGAGTAWHLLDTSRAVRPLILQEHRG